MIKIGENCAANQRKSQERKMDKMYKYQRLPDSISKFPKRILCMSFIKTLSY